MDYDKLLTLGGEVGFQLLLCGAEIYRVEESVNYLLESYGVTTGEVFAIPNCMIVSLTSPDHKPLTCVRRVQSHNTDIGQLELLNDLCRRFCRENPPPETALALLAEAISRRKSYARRMKLLAYFIGTGAFCLFFGGTWRDALACGVAGLAIGLCLLFMERLGTNLFFKTIAGGFVCGLACVSMTVVGLGQHTNLIITGAIMALVPGLVITNFMRDIMAGDMVSGLSKLADSLLTATGIALGTGLALSLTRLLWGVV